jgi:hypothetical protein
MAHLIVVVAANPGGTLGCKAQRHHAGDRPVEELRLRHSGGQVNATRLDVAGVG